MSAIWTYVQNVQPCPRCVKWAGLHATAECRRKVNSKDVKCVLCEGNHPANYKGCNVYKELQQKTFPSLIKKHIIASKNVIIDSKIKPGTFYAQIVAPTIEKPTDQSNEITELKSMLKMIMEQMSAMFSVLNTVLSKMAK